MQRLIAALLTYLGLASAALAQSTFTMPPPAGVFLGGYQVVASCGGASLSANNLAFGSMDTTGKICTNASSSGTSSVILAPTAAASAGITPIVSASAEATHVLKASPGNVYSAYATNLTGTGGFFLILNSTTAPSDGAVTPLACAPLSANGSASINYAPGPPGVFSTGITAVVTSASTCFTKTTGTITAFISGSVQ